MDFIHEFWVEMLPFLQGYEFIYIFLDIVTVWVLIQAVMIIPSRLLLGGGSKIWDN